MQPMMIKTIPAVIEPESSDTIPAMTRIAAAIESSGPMIS